MKCHNGFDHCSIIYSRRIMRSDLKTACFEIPGFSNYLLSNKCVKSQLFNTSFGNQLEIIPAFGSVSCSCHNLWFEGCKPKPRCATRSARQVSSFQVTDGKRSEVLRWSVLVATTFKQLGLTPRGLCWFLRGQILGNNPEKTPKNPLNLGPFGFSVFITCGATKSLEPVAFGT